MNIFLVIAFSLSIVIPVVVSFIRIRHIDKVYYPFLYLLWVGLINEVLSIYLIKKLHTSNAINNNIFYLAEALLLTYQFRKWGLFGERRPKVYEFLMCSYLVFWIAEHFVFASISEFGSHFIIFHSFVIVLLSITMFNKLLVRENRNLLKNSIFIICVAFIVFFTYAVFVELAMVYDERLSTSFKTAVSRIMAFINLFTNLLFALAVLWMPKRQGFILT